MPVQVAVRNGNIAAQTTAQGNQLGEQLVAQGLPPYAEMIRKGNGWSVMSVVAVAGLVVRPTATAAFEIWNGNNVGGRSLIIDRLFWLNLGLDQRRRGLHRLGGRGGGESGAGGGRQRDRARPFGQTV